MKKKTKAAGERVGKLSRAQVASFSCSGCGKEGRVFVPGWAWNPIMIETARRVRVKAIEDAAKAVGDLLRETNNK